MFSVFSNVKKLQQLSMTCVLPINIHTHDCMHCMLSPQLEVIFVSATTVECPLS